MNGKGRGPEKGYNRQAYAENYDAIFRCNQRKEPMKTPEQEQPDQPTAIRAHLATLSKPSAHSKPDETKGSK